jgi:UDP-N-acetylglucosamine 1-carboxyvinyltransferase
MDITVKGGQTLSGEIAPSGYKNSAVALIPATILFDKPVTLENIPDIKDVERLLNILKKLGSKFNWDKEKNTLDIDNSKLRFTKLDHEDLGNMKGVSLLWGPMLARFKKVDFRDLPGGCTLGHRTLGPHYQAFSDLGVKIVNADGTSEMDSTHAQPDEVMLTEVSPTATENVIMLATGLPGITKIVGAAAEPQVQDLCSFLIKSGVNIRGVGSSVLEIEGTNELTPVSHKITSDCHEIATFIALSASTGGSLIIHNVNRKLFMPIDRVFRNFGVNIQYDETTAKIEKNQRIKIHNEEGRGYLIVRGQPWPGLLVDNLPLFIPLALAAESGQVLFHNWMYEAGLFWTSELTKLGANIIMADPHRVIVTAGNKLKGATNLEAPYIIRATVAMVMAAMIAEGESKIINADALYRGHPHFSENLRKLGAQIEEITVVKR